MASDALQDRIRGFRAAKAAFQALPQVTRDRLNVATELTAREIARLAKANLLASPSVQTRALLNAVGWTMNAKSGRGRAGVANVTTTVTVGSRRIRVRGLLIAGRGGSARTAAGAKTVNPRRYAHLVEFGTRRFPAEPFMLPAAEAEKAPYLARCRATGRPIEQDLAAVGARVL